MDVLIIIGAIVVVACAVMGWILLRAGRRPLSDFEVLVDAIESGQQDAQTPSDIGRDTLQSGGGTDGALSPAKPAVAPRIPEARRPMGAGGER